ncbi:MAG TPA: adenylyl-sulfate kinase [Chthonomonadaceae bacterium]|nr:adenylyl-sulfate kinase [Chthonomonadaceae bacterium]
MSIRARRGTWFPYCARKKGQLMGQHQGFILWFTGLSGAGKSTLAEKLVAEFRDKGYKVELLDGDEVRTHLSKGLGFSKEDRDTNIRRIGWVARVLARNGVIAITAAISPYREIRDEIRSDIENEGRTTFVEVFAFAPLEALVERDVKGLYKKALAGEIKNFTGVSDPYEAPETPEITAYTSTETVEESAARILSYLTEQGLIGLS